MEISTSSNQVTITGNIKTVMDFQELKSSVDLLSSQHKSITINIVDSLSITSSVIGYFTKLVLKDKIDINMNIGNEKLLELLSELHLTTTFKARKA